MNIMTVKMQPTSSSSISNDCIMAKVIGLLTSTVIILKHRFKTAYSQILLPEKAAVFGITWRLFL